MVDGERAGASPRAGCAPHDDLVEFVGGGEREARGVQVTVVYSGGVVLCFFLFFFGDFFVCLSLLQPKETVALSRLSSLPLGLFSMALWLSLSIVLWWVFLNARPHGE